MSDSDLTPTQRHSLDQLRELTNGADDEVSIGVLNSVEWDVQKAAELIFEGGVLNNAAANTSSSNPGADTRSSLSSTSARSIPPSRPSTTTTTMEEFEIDDGDEDTALIGRGRGGRGGPHRPPRPLILTLLSLPLTFLTSLFRVIFHILRFPFTFLPFGGGASGGPSPRSGWFLGLGLSLSSSLGGTRRRGLLGATGTTGVEKWVRELEEETGAVCLPPPSGSSGIVSGSASGTATTNGTLTARPTASSTNGKSPIDFTQTGKHLPPFLLCTYEDLLKRCQKEYKIGCVVLVSEEHDDVGEFKRSTLTDPTFLKTLYENDVLVWGGDVRDREAWSASEKLQATTYPFVSFIALQPRRDPGSSRGNPTSSSTPPVLTVLSRHQGPSYSSSSSSSSSSNTPALPTSAQSLTSHLLTSLIPRVQPYLSRLLHTQTQRSTQLTRDRQIRADQDRQYEETMRRDREKIESAMRREREERQRVERERREKEAKELADRERAVREKREREERERTREVVREWIVIHFTEKSGGQGTRIAIRLPSGKRVIEVFDKEEGTVTGLYARVESLLGRGVSENGVVKGNDERVLLGTPKDQKEAEEMLDVYIASCVSTSSKGEDASPYAYTSPVHFWGFTIATSYPRVEIPWVEGTKLGDLDGLKGGGQVVVELVSNGGGNHGGRKSVEGRKSLEGRPSVEGRKSTDSRKSVEGKGNGAKEQEKEEEESDGYETESTDEE